MTATLVAFQRPDIPWGRPERPLIIGKDILELLSSSMYVDPMAMYREYVQNSADATDLARSAGLSPAEGLVSIKIDAVARTILIRDNGSGLSEADFAQKLTALGGSSKRGSAARGFRGVGRLAGLAFAQEIVFRSRQQGERTVHELRWNGRDVRAMLRSTETRDLHEIVQKSVETREVSGQGWPDKFFEVELRGVVRHKDDRLLNHDAVFNYLAQVAPVPFHQDFQFSDQISSLLQTHGIKTGAIDIEVEGRGRVYRPHRNALPFGKSGETKFQELTTIYTPGRDGATAAVTWVLHSDYRGALPLASLVEGWRFRVGDIQIGNNDLMVALFPEPRFNSWCVAETHVIDSRILPNGRRDHFEQNSYYLDLINHLAPHAREIAQRCRASSIYRNLIRHIEHGLSNSEQRLKILSKRALLDGSAARLSTQLIQDLDHVQRLASRSVISPDQQSRYQKRIRRLQQRAQQLKHSDNRQSALDAFTPAQRMILSEVLKSIYRGHSDINQAQALVDRILKSVAKTLNRTRPKT